MFENVCRLCLGTHDLLCLFDSKLKQDMAEIIKVTSGVEIQKSDVVSQMVCRTCCQITIKMFQFRTTSIKNDKELKARSVVQRVVELSKRKSDINNIDSKTVARSSVSGSCDDSIKSSDQATTPSLKYKLAHPSIKDIIKKYPNIVLPPSCLKSHVGAYITLVTNEVDEWFREKNFTDDQIRKLKNEAGLHTPSEKSTSPSKMATQKQLCTEKMDSDKPRITKRSCTPDLSNSSKRIKLSDKKVYIESNCNDVLENAHKMSKRKDRVDESAMSNCSKRASSSTTDKVSENRPTETMLEPTGSLLNSQVPKESVSEQTVLNKKTTNGPQLSTESISESTVLNKETDNGSQLSTASVSEPTVLKNTFMGSQLSTESVSEPTDKNLINGEHDISSPQDDLSKGHVHGNKEDWNNVATDSSSTCSSSSTVDPKEFPSEGVSKSSNAPDSSLWSLAKQSNNLYVCKICNSHYFKHKDLQRHQRKVHTRCPFCSRTFNTMALRSIHSNYYCTKNKSRKEAIVILRKVDTDKKIREQYPNVFELFEEEKKVEEESALDNNTNNTPRETDNAETVSDLSELLDIAQVYQGDTLPQNVVNETSSSSTFTVGDNVICISDEESELERSTQMNDQSTKKRIVRTVNNEIINKIDIKDSNINVLKQILKNIKLKAKSKGNRQEPFNNSSIIDSRAGKVKIFKNLRNNLHRYNIPIEIEHNRNIMVEYRVASHIKPKKSRDTWERMDPITINKSPNPPLPSSSVAPPNCTTINVPTNQGLMNGSVVYQTNNNAMVPPNKLMLSSASVIKTIPLVLNSNTNICTTNCNSFTILLPNSLIQKDSTNNPLPLMASNTIYVGPSSNVQCVSNTFQSVTNSLTSISTSATNVTTISNDVINRNTSITNASVDTSAGHPAIRVKNIKELC